MKNTIKLFFLLTINCVFAQVTDTGNEVGIGTTNPNAKLHVHESSTLGSSSGNFQILSRISGAGGNHVMENKWLIRDENGSTWLTARFHNGISVDGSYLTPGINTRTWWERDPKAGNQYWGNAADVEMALVNGNLGVGIPNPLSKTHIYNGASGGTPHYLADVTIEDNDDGMVSILTPSNRTAYFGFGNEIDNYVGGIQYEHANDRMVFRVNDHVSDMTIDRNGYVGIGTQNPDSKLSVKGNIHTNEVKVDLLGAVAPDYVFYKDYDLKSLKEVETYIAKQGHLPNIPSAKDMEADGIMLKELNLKLLEKIEELTLYTINQEKRIDILESKNNELVVLLEKLVKSLEK